MPTGSQKKQENSRRTSTSVSLTMLKSLCGSQQLWKILKEMGIPDPLTCLLRDLYAGQEPTARNLHGTSTGSKLGNEYVKAEYRHPAYLIHIQSTLTP